MEQNCDGCLYLCRFSMGNYCEMRNKFVKDLEQSGCINWKRKPKKKQHEEDTWEWVQLEMRIDK